ncbi:MAG TPA: YcxB family protein, partial [Humisphaera sp.]|nr:YcxB family protein [Humisphaera sp.]
VGMVWDDSNSESTYPWDTLTGFVETPNLFNIYKDDPTQKLKTIIIAIPKRAFADPVALHAFRALLQAKLNDLCL